VDGLRFPHTPSNVPPYTFAGAKQSSPKESSSADGGAQSIDEISQKYPGRPYPNFRGVPETRVIVTTEAHSVVEPG